MKIKKILFLILIFLSVFFIYKKTYKENLIYVALGDALAAGQNPYGEIGYGYSDYVADYLKQNNKLKSYIYEYATCGYTIDDIMDDINNNKVVVNNGKQVNIRNILRESNMVTISIGEKYIAEIIKDSILQKNNIDKLNVKNNIDVIAVEFDNLLKSIKKYAKNEMIVIGYYNPFPNFITYKSDIDEIIGYSDKVLKSVCDNNKVTFVKISDIFNNYEQYFPNSLDVHPNTLGYEKIFFEIKPILHQKYTFND